MPDGTAYKIHSADFTQALVLEAGAGVLLVSSKGMPHRLVASEQEALRVAKAVGKLEPWRTSGDAPWSGKCEIPQDRFEAMRAASIAAWDEPERLAAAAERERLAADPRTAEREAQRERDQRRAALEESRRKAAEAAAEAEAAERAAEQADADARELAELRAAAARAREADAAVDVV